MSKKILWLTTSSMNVEPVIDSLESCGFDIQIEKVNFDSVAENYFFDEQLYVDVAQRKPDAVFYIGSLEGPYLARPHVFQMIRDFTPIVNFVFDGACPNGWPTLKKFRENKCFTITVNIDGNQDWPKGENDMTTLCPIDPRPYNKQVEKSVKVGFCGGSASSDRAALLKRLEAEGLIERQERDESAGSYPKYADFMLKCQAVVNMAKSGSGQSMQVKARVVEAGLASACLLEPKGSPTKNWLKPDVEYLEYSNTEDLMAIIRVLSLKDSSMAERIGKALHKRVTSDYSPTAIFTKIFQKIGLEVSGK